MIDSAVLKPNMNEINEMNKDDDIINKYTQKFPEFANL